MSKRSNKRIARDAAKAVKKMSTFEKVVLFIVIVAIIAVAVYGYYQGWFDKFLNPITGNETPIVAEGEVSVHFPELGNDKTGDCIYIKVGDVDILVDAGSDYDSADDIETYVDQYCADNTLEFVIATHAHLDHIAGFAGNGSYPSLFTKFVCETIIDFPLANTTSKVYQNYKTQRDLEVQHGAKHYTALECYNNENGAQRVYNLNEEGTIQLEILYSYYYENKASSENDYSVCFLIRHGSNNYLFTGDLEERGEIAMVDYYNEHHGGLPQCTLYKAGHHGSKTSSSVELLEQIKPQYAVVTTVAGTDEYQTSTILNQFPTQTFINNIAPYTDKVYVTSMVADNADGYTSMNGDVVFNCIDGEITVSCSNNNTVLKDTDWFKMYRFTPVEWGGVS